MGFLTDAMLDSGALRRRLNDSTNGLHYWDESVGRRCFVWDTVNNRFQLVYGDTGWRDVLTSINTNWAAAASAPALRIRRVNSSVYMEVRIQRVTASGARNAHDVIYTVPTGFKIGSFIHHGVVYGATTGVQGLLESQSDTASVAVFFPAGGTYAAGELVYGATSWSTTDAWPATLPGVASGTIPFN